MRKELVERERKAASSKCESVVVLVTLFLLKYHIFDELSESKYAKLIRYNHRVRV
jgi:hypothetical protein